MEAVESTDAQGEATMAEIPLMHEETQAPRGDCKKCKETRQQRLIQMLMLLNVGFFLLAVVLVLSIFRAFGGRDSRVGVPSGSNSTLPDSVYCKWSMASKKAGTLKILTAFP